MNQRSLDYPLQGLLSGNVLNGNPTPNRMEIPTPGLRQVQDKSDYSEVIVDNNTNPFGLIREFFGGGYKAQATAASATSHRNNASTLGVVQVQGEMPNLDSGMASSHFIPFMQFYGPSVTEAPFTGQNLSYCPLNVQTSGDLLHRPLEGSVPDSNDSKNRAIQHKVLLAYIQHKKSMRTGEDAEISFLNLMHLAVCSNYSCKCEKFFSLISHYNGCHEASCDICAPVWCASQTNELHPKFLHVKRGILRDSRDEDSEQLLCGKLETRQHYLKRLKVEHPSSPSLPNNGMCYAMAPLMVEKCYPKLPPLQQLPESPVSSSSEAMEVNMELLPKVIEDSASTKETVTDVAGSSPILTTESSLGLSEVVVCSYKLKETDAIGSHKEEDMDLRDETRTAVNVKYHSNDLEFNTMPSFSGGHATDCVGGEAEARTNSNQAELAIENELIPQESNCEKEIKSESQKMKAVSLIENFTAQQIQDHISSLRQCIDQDVPKKERGNRTVDVGSENLCQLCRADKLSLAPAPIYCSSCGGRIRRNAVYYCTSEENDIRHCLCTSCYKASRRRSIISSEIALSNAKLVKKKNDEEVEESWVQCDKCQGWQHQICALFNDKNDMEGKAQFICPNCCLIEIQNGERMPPLLCTAFGAKDLPRTMLSDHIEQRLFMRLQKEREEKAVVAGKIADEFPEAEGLVVRVVLSVDKVVKVKEQLLDILHNENYPSELPYKSKVIVLFQKIEGVDVLLFSMYVQEFGSECSHPNQRCVYISYLDSVKYFRPDTETAAGEALRTIIYHEILIGHLEYCKRRGFATCYLWVCPPTKGEDYILYCHPEIQKTPKSDKLQRWYHSMLRKAAKDGVVVNLTNLYDSFFVPTVQNNSKVTAANLPYFDGDYWSGAAEDVIKKITKETSEASEKMSKKIMSKRMLKAMGHTNPSADATKDILLMQKLGQNILPIKEDFIIAHLQFVCTCCRRAVLSGWRWFCSRCKSFQLCDRCHEAEENIYKDCSHTLCTGEKHLMHKIMVDDVPFDTDDKDVSVDNDLFESRHSFLSFCQKNNYQFDTLRRAKYSSMMILHYLHNPTTHLRDDHSLHSHELTRHSYAANSVTENTGAQKRDLQGTPVLQVLLHASQCHSRCADPNCQRIKKLFYHGKICRVRVAQGCRHCKNMWFMLLEHSKNCKDSDCGVPRCRDIKQHLKFSTQQSETVGRTEQD